MGCDSARMSVAFVAIISSLAFGVQPTAAADPPQGAAAAPATLPFQVEATDAIEVLDSPCVVYSSADVASGGLSGPLTGGDSRTVQVTGPLSGQGGDASCLPAGATAVVATISAVDPRPWAT